MKHQAGTLLFTRACEGILKNCLGRAWLCFQPCCTRLFCCGSSATSELCTKYKLLWCWGFPYTGSV